MVRNIGKLLLSARQGGRRRANPSAISRMAFGRSSLCRPSQSDDGQVSAFRVVLDVEDERDPGLTPDENLG